MKPQRTLWMKRRSRTGVGDVRVDFNRASEKNIHGHRRQDDVHCLGEGQRAENADMNAD
jgi:hypothetical protein